MRRQNFVGHSGRAQKIAFTRDRPDKVLQRKRIGVGVRGGGRGEGEGEEEGEARGAIALNVI